MTLRFKRLTIVAIALAGSAVLGCGPVLAPIPDKSKFFTLSPVDAGSAQAPAPVTLGVGPINMPSYLDRNSVVIRTGPNEMDVSAIDRWAEPVTVNFTRTLTEDLSRTLEPKQIVQFPWYPPAVPDYQVEIYVFRFEADSSGTAILAGKWTLKRPIDHKTLYSSDMNITEPVAKGDGGGAAALSKALGQLTTEISTVIRQQPPPQPAANSPV